VQPDRKLVLARWSVAFVFFLNGALLGGLFPYLPVLKLGLHLSDQDLGLCLLFSPIGAVTSLAFMGRIISRFGTRRVTLVTATLLCAVIPFALIAPNVWALRLCLLLFGASNGSMDASINTEAVMVQHQYAKPIMSFTHGCWSLGGFMAAACVALASKFGCSPVIYSAVASVIMYACIWWACSYFLVEDKTEATGEPHFAFPRGTLLLISVLTACAYAGEGASYDWSAVFFRVTLRTTESVAAFGFGSFVGAMALARLLGDGIVHRLGNRRSLQIGSVVATCGVLVAVVSTSPLISAAGYAMCGIGVANLVPILFRASGSVPGIPPGVGVAAASTFAYSAFFLSPPIIGFVADRVSLPFALGMMGFLVLIIGANANRALKETTLTESA